MVNFTGWTVGGIAGYPNRWGQDTVGWHDSFEGAIYYYRGVQSNFDTDNDGQPDATDPDDGTSALDCINVGRDGIPANGDECVAPTVLAGAASCSVTWVQHMAMYCPNLPSGLRWIEYTAHTLSTTYYPADIGVSRDGHVSSKTFP